MRIGSFDVGVLNLAVLIADVHDGRVSRVVHLERIDTTEACTREACPLGHTRTATDRLSHVIKDRQALLDTCTTILIERQPLTGLTDVEQLLFAYFRDRAVLVSPNAMHKFFNIGQYTYEGRKWRTVGIADAFLSAPEHAHALALFENLGERRHDVADALCLLIYHLASTDEKRAQPKDTVKREERSKKSKTSSPAMLHKDMDEEEAKAAFTQSISRFVYTPSQKLFASRKATTRESTSESTT